MPRMHFRNRSPRSCEPYKSTLFVNVSAYAFWIDKMIKWQASICGISPTYARYALYNVGRSKTAPSVSIAC